MGFCSLSLLNEGRKEQQICGTKYPILMVHGVFFRDWKYFNYWGRIPKELTDNGAHVFYGNHNSASPVEQAAQELKQRILDVMRETGSEKLNIIAHSKGGVDVRYAISCLMAIDSSTRGAVAGYPKVSVLLYYNKDNVAASENVIFTGTKFSEALLLEIAYVVEQGTNLRLTPGLADKTRLGQAIQAISEKEASELFAFALETYATPGLDDKRALVEDAIKSSDEKEALDIYVSALEIYESGLATQLEVDEAIAQLRVHF